MDLQISKHAKDMALERVGPNTDVRAIWRKSYIAKPEHFKEFSMAECEGFEYRVAEHLGEKFMLVIDAHYFKVVTIVKKGGHCVKKTKS